MAVTVIGNKLQVEVLADESTKTQLNEIQEEVRNLDERVDTILTTPAESVSAQEIIDARQGELSLGANITKIKSQLAQTTYQVTSFGAVGDGINDDSDAFELALSSVENGGTLMLPFTPNGYTLSRGINLDGKSNITIKGVGGRVKILNRSGSNINTISIKNGNNITIENLEIDVNGSNQDASLYPAYINSGLYLSDIEGLTIKNILVKNSIRDLKLLRCKNIYVENVHVDGARVDGWSIDDCEKGTFRNVSAKNVTNVIVGDANGFEIEDGSKDLNFYDIYAENCSEGSGFKIKSHDGVIICERISVYNYTSVDNLVAFEVINKCKDIFATNIKGNSLSHGIAIADQPENIKLVSVDVVSGNSALLINDCNGLFVSGGSLEGPNAIQLNSGVINDLIIKDLNLISSTHQTINILDFTGVRKNVVFENVRVESTSNSTMWLHGGEWDKLVFKNCRFVIPSGTRRVIIDNTTGAYFIGCDVESSSNVGVSIRYFAEDIRFWGGNITALKQGIALGFENRSTNVKLDDIEIIGVTFKDTENFIAISSTEEAPLNNLKVSNCTFKNGNVILWENSRGADLITLTGNVLINATYVDGTYETNVVKSGNNPTI